MSARRPACAVDVDNTLIVQFERVQQKLDVIEYHGTILEVVIDDLTLDQYDTRQMKSFP